MGKRSRKPSGGPSPATKAPKSTRTASALREVQPASGTGERLKQSWKLAGSRPAAKGGMKGVGAGIEPPPPIWGPVPVNEILNLLGVVLVIVGLTRGLVDGQSAMIAGAAMCAIATFELSLREHLAGYKPHTLLLAILTAAAVGSALALFGDANPTRTLIAIVVFVIVLGLGLQGWSRLYTQRRRRALEALGR